MAKKLSAAEFALKRQAHEAAVEAAAAILLSGDPTVFRFEAELRHHLRSHWCLMGLRWQKADDKAVLIVDQALRRLNAVRPTWREGQYEFARGGGRLFCANIRCAQIITRVTDQATMYCSEVCRLRAKSMRGYWEEQAARVEYARARRKLMRAAAKPRNCEWCKSEFQPLDYTGKKPQRFCSSKCRSRYASSCSPWRKNGQGPKPNGHLNGNGHSAPLAALISGDTVLPRKRPSLGRRFEAIGG